MGSGAGLGRWVCLKVFSVTRHPAALLLICFRFGRAGRWVAAVGVGGQRLNRGTVAFRHRHRDVRDARLTDIPHAVAVEVVKDRPGQRTRKERTRRAQFAVVVLIERVGQIEGWLV